jgi:4-hydroxybenzoate polyprenyltransferase
MRRVILALLDAVCITRPVVLIPVWGFALLGLDRGHAAGGGAAVGIWTAVWIGVFSLSVAAVYVVNQVADLDADAVNDGFPLLTKGGVSRRLAATTAAVCAAASTALPLLRLPMLSALAGAALAVGAVYCLKPLRLSGRPVLDFLANAVGYGGIAFGVGWVLSGAPTGLFTGRFAQAALPYVLLMCAGSISSTIPDMPGDAAAGKRTTAVVFGRMPAHCLALAMLVAGGVAGHLAGDVQSVVCAALVVPLYLAYLVAPQPALCEATYKVGGAILMLVAVVRFPLFGAAGLIVLLATRMYFRFRHKVNYPAILPARPISK